MFPLCMYVRCIWAFKQQQQQQKKTNKNKQKNEKKLRERREEKQRITFFSINIVKKEQRTKYLRWLQNLAFLVENLVFSWSCLLIMERSWSFGEDHDVHNVVLFMQVLSFLLCCYVTPHTQSELSVFNFPLQITFFFFLFWRSIVLPVCLWSCHSLNLFPLNSSPVRKICQKPYFFVLETPTIQPFGFAMCIIRQSFFLLLLPLQCRLIQFFIFLVWLSNNSAFFWKRNVLVSKVAFFF